LEKFLDRLQRLMPLNTDEAAELARTCGGVVQFEEGSDLVREGARPECLHVLVEGWACRYVLLPDGRRHIPALLLPGDMADLDAFATDRLEYGVSTLTRCRVAILSRPALKAAIERTPNLGRALLALALHENAMLTRRNVSLGRRTAREQVAGLLCELVTRLADASGGTRATRHTLPLTQAELADVLGLSAVHVNRVLQGLRADGLVRLASGKLEMLDWAGLVAAAAFQPDHAGPAPSHALSAVTSGSAAREPLPSHA
jgi:CRP-like cAMP-binding protein